jgi:galactokinase
MTPPTRDFAAHLERLRHLPEHGNPLLCTLFEKQSPVLVARAPGRLDVMGGIADYSGSLVLEMPIAEATFAAVQRSPEPGIVVASLNQSDQEKARVARISPQEWKRLFSSEYEVIQESLANNRDSAWAAYVVGSVIALLRETGSALSSGLRILVDSLIPEGKGVSSSAAIEVATMRAVAELADIDLAGEELARLCQLAENRIVGAPCGIMDQMTAVLGRESELLALRCQPAIVEGFVAIPNEIEFWGIDSGIRHAVSGSDYSSVRCGAFMGYRMIAEAAGFPIHISTDAPGTVGVDDKQWKGYLANITPREFRERFASVLPEEISGADFQRRFYGTTDHVTRIDPDRNYAVLAPTLHPIEENARVQRFRSLLQSPITDDSLIELGQLMFAAHASYSACDLGSDGTDLLIELVRNAGPASGLYGAKITGGGSGGTVAILGGTDAGPAVRKIAQQYMDRTGRHAYIFHGSSPGAYGTPVVEVII